MSATTSPPPRFRLHPALVPSVILLIVAASGYSGTLDAAASHGPLGTMQTVARTYLDRSQTRAVEAFAVGRGINATISVLKSIQITPVIADVAPLQALEPIDDIAKQFSDVMAISIVAIGLQRLLASVAQAWAFAGLLPIGCLLWATGLCCARWSPLGPRLSAIGRGLVVLAVFARLVIPVAGWAGNALTQHFLETDLNSAVGALQAANGGAAKLASEAALTPSPPAPAQQSAPAAPPPAPGAVQPSYGARIRNFVGGAVQGAEDLAQGAVSGVRAFVPDTHAVAATFKDVPENMVRAIEIFLVQTIVTPLAVAGLLYSVLRNLARRHP